jgi:hypothetical protein
MKNKATKRAKTRTRHGKKKTRNHRKKVMRGGLVTTGFGFGGETVSETTGAKIYKPETGQWENQTQHQVGPFKWSTQSPPSGSDSESKDSETGSGTEEKSSTPISVIIAGVIIVGAIAAKIVTGK